MGHALRVVFFLCTALEFCSVASAADMPLKAPPPAPRPYSWTGIYIGANTAHAWVTGFVTEAATGASLPGVNDGFIGGGQLGFNYQISDWVLGFEGDFDGTSLRKTSDTVNLGAAAIQASTRTNWVSTAAGRVGLAVDQGLLFDHSLLYVKGGGAWVDNRAALANLTTGNAISSSNTSNGWMFGIGWEWAFAPQWSATLEYDLVRLNSWSQSNTVLVNGVADNLTLTRDIDMIKVGVNYRFNGNSY